MSNYNVIKLSATNRNMMPSIMQTGSKRQSFAISRISYNDLSF